MARHARTNPLLNLLARLGWQRNPDLWTVRCRDQRGRRAQLTVHLATEGVRLTSSSPGTWVLTPLEAGRLRSALRDALFSLDRLASSEDGGIEIDSRSTEFPSPQPLGVPLPRQRVELGLITRPSVDEIASRVAQAQLPELEVKRGHHDDKSDHQLSGGTSVAA
jgi:hypothetical protein